MTRHTATVSRTGLVIVGLILLLGGGAVLARGLNASSSILGSAHAPLATHSQVRYPAQHGWVWPVTAENRADPATTRTRIETEALPNLRTALELDTIPTVLRIRFSRAFGRHLT